MSRSVVACAILACSAPARDASPIVAPGPRLPDNAEPVAYTLRLDVDPLREDFDGHVTIRVLLREPADHVWLNLDEIDVVRASFRAGGPAEPLVQVQTGDEMRAFSFHRVLPRGEVTLDIEYRGHTKHDQEGLFRQTLGKLTYLYSQGESAFARRIAPCFDEPRWKVPWSVTIVAPSGEIALANAPEVSERELADHKTEHVFAPTPPIASYLVAIAVGPFEMVDAGTVGKHAVPVRVAALASTSRAVGVVKARLPAIVDAAEQLLDDPLPLAKLDLVAVPHLFGAMEHPGLITCDQYVLSGDPDWPPVMRHFVHVAAHEIVHQWFGNLVTPAWWDDLWLGEAFASWLGDRIAERLGGFEDPEVRRALAREGALAADEQPGAKPLRPQIVRPDEAEDTFDAIAYDKGETVLQTIAAWQGEDVFLARLRSYLRAHRGGTATARDLYAAIGEPAAKALASYLERPGVPNVELAQHCTGAPAISAHVRGGFAVPVCVRYGTTGTSHRTCQLVADRAEIALEGSCPTWLVANDRSGYYEVAGPLVMTPALGQLSSGELVAAGDDVADAFLRGELGARDALAMLDRLAAKKTLPAQLGALAIAQAIDPIVDDGTRDAWSAWLARRFAVALEPGPLFSPSANGETARRDELVAIISPSDLPISSVAAAQNKVLHPKPDVPTDELYVWAANRDPVHAFVAWLDSKPPGNAYEWNDWIEEMQRSSTRSALWQALRPHLGDVLATLGDSALDLLGPASMLCDATARAEVSRAFGAIATTDRDRTRVAHALASIDRCIARRRRAGEVAAALTPTSGATP